MRLLIVAAGIVVYLTSFQGAFLFDDDPAIINNPNIRSLWPLQDAVSAPPQAPVAGRPVAALSLALNYAVGDLDPWGYHFFNLVVHLLAGLTLFGIVRGTLSGPRLNERHGSSARNVAAVVALLWVIHPLQTEGVTYVTQRTESLMGLFYLLTLYCALRGRDSPRPVFWHAAAIVACCLGMATKEVMVTAPVLVLLHDAVFGAGSIRRAVRSRAWFYGGLATTWIILAVLMAPGPRSKSVGLSHGVSAFQYALNQCEVIIGYVRLAFWPHPLILDYGTPLRLTLEQVAPHALGLAVLLVGTVVMLLRRPQLGFLGAWFFLILAPTSSFVPIATEVAAERRMYLPLAGIVTLVVVGVRRAMDLLPASVFGSPSRCRALAAALVLAVAIPLGCATSRRNAAYAEPNAMWRDVVVHRPQNARAQCGKAAALAAGGDYEGALRHYGIALQIEPNDSVTHHNVGGVLARMGRYDEAVERFAAAVALTPDFVIAQTSLGNALRLKGDLAGAIVAHQKAIEIDPTHGDAWYNLGLDLEAQGSRGQAVEAFQESVRLNPGHRSAQAALQAATSRPAEQ